jgi:ABC-2 type transport system ATP-binding protein
LVNNMDRIAEVDGVSFSHGRHHVLRELTWHIPPGITGLLGPNGAGKTTLIRCLVGLAEPDSGRVTLPTSRRDTRGRGGPSPIGYVPQRCSAPGNLRVRRVVEYAAWLQGVPARDVPLSAGRAMAMLGLQGLADRRFRTLSGGERQRVLIASGLAHGPSILVLDEPTVGLDPSHRLAVRRAIGRLDGLRGVLVSTHLLEDVEHLCDNVGILSDGRIRFAGSIAQLHERVSQLGKASGASAFGSEFEHAYEALVTSADEGLS